MKKTLFILTLLFSVNVAFSQTNLEVSLCGNTENTVEKEKSIVKIISQKELFECSKIIPNNKDYKVSSCSLGMIADGNYLEVKITGNHFTGKALGYIKKHNPKKIYIEKIKLINTKGTIITGKPLTLIIKNQHH